MTLSPYFVEVFTLPRATPPRQRTLGFQPLHGGRICGVLVDVHDPWHRIAARCQSLTEEPFGGCGISFGREQKVDRLTHGGDCTIQILIFAFYRYIGLVDPIALVRRLQI